MRPLTRRDLIHLLGCVATFTLAMLLVGAAWVGVALRAL